MIKNHENHTAPLSPEEYTFASFLEKLFKSGRILSHNKILAPDLCLIIMRRFLLEKFQEVRLRKIINYLCRESVVFIGSGSKGYYLVEDPREMLSCIESMKDRRDALSARIEGMEIMYNRAIEEQKNKKPNSKGGELF